MAQIIVEMFHPQQEGAKALAHFESTFSQHQVPDDIPEYKITSGDKLIDILAVTKMVSTKNEARRLLKEGAVSRDGQAITDENWTPGKGVLKIGKRRFLRLT